MDCVNWRASGVTFFSHQRRKVENAKTEQVLLLQIWQKILLPSVSSLPTQKSTPTFASTFFKPLFEKDNLCLLGKYANFVVPHHDSVRAHTAAATVQWLEISAINLFLCGIGPLTLPICRPWIIRWMEFSSADFGSERHAAWRDWNGPYTRIGQSVCRSLCWNTFCLAIRVKLMI